MELGDEGGFGGASDAIADGRDELGKEGNPRYWFKLGRLEIADLASGATEKPGKKIDECGLKKIIDYLGLGASVELRAIKGDDKYVEAWTDKDFELPEPMPEPLPEPDASAREKP